MSDSTHEPCRRDDRSGDVKIVVSGHMPDGWALMNGKDNEKPAGSGFDLSGICDTFIERVDGSDGHRS